MEGFAQTTATVAAAAALSGFSEHPVQGTVMIDEEMERSKYRDVSHVHCATLHSNMESTHGVIGIRSFRQHSN
ncbi:hypothetical protein DAEQUDRAFT_570252 [Daedalea quercina L-15889]|uniref:Uncharacterized protein n=1 Tax=Daedalea quercina L-15889 TaxID=1314783 RepID=A0A165LWQ3_9APHY|nr:hypothetical protein DAEQUDRAFT_570252 [Daedalea quercina L-15889]